MKKSELARRLARRKGVTQAEAADELDRVVNQILAKLRAGQSAPLPGLGNFLPGPKGAFHFEKEPRGPRGRK